jgi:acetyl esterase
MAAVVTLMEKERMGPSIAGQILFWPVSDSSFDTPSYLEFQSGHFLTRAMMQWFWDAYTADPAQRRGALASPLQATPDQLKGLPPVLIQTAEKDVLRDEAEAYGRALDAAGVDVVVTRYNGVINDFGLLNALADLPATRAVLHQASEEIKARLKGDLDGQKVTPK